MAQEAMEDLQTLEMSQGGLYLGEKVAFDTQRIMCTTKNVKSEKSEVYCLLVSWRLVKDYFEPEKSMSVWHKSPRGPRGRPPPCAHHQGLFPVI